MPTSYEKIRSTIDIVVEMIEEKSQGSSHEEILILLDIVSDLCEKQIKLNNRYKFGHVNILVGPHTPEGTIITTQRIADSLKQDLAENQ